MKKLVFLFIASLLMISMAWGQTNPTAQSLDYSQNFGTTSFSSLPAGFAAWNGTGLKKSLAQAESSVPTGNATITARIATNTTAGVSGLAISNNARVYIQTSSNATNGTNQLALAIDTTDKENVLLSFVVKVELPPDASRAYGVVAQYRVGTSGSWTTLSNGYVEYTNQTAGTTTSFTDLALGSDANNQATVQIRWATWRADGSGSSGGLSIDDISVSSSGASSPPTITVAPSTLTGFGYAVGYGPSTYQTFTVSGSDLTDDIDLTAPTHYEISESSGSGYTGSISLTKSGGSVAETTIYVRLKSGLSAGDYNGENITAASTDATSKTVTCSGSVITPATTTLPYSEPFTSDLSGVYTYTVSGNKPWLYSSGVASCNGYQGTGNEQHWMILPGINFNSYSNERMSFTTDATYGTIDANNYLKLYYSTNYSGYGDPNAAGVTWTEISYTNGGVGGGVTSSGILDLSAISGSSVFIGFKYLATNSPTRWYVDDISIYEATPAITVIDNLNNFTYVHNAGPSAEQSFTVSGADLSENISITAPTNYEISTSTGGSFSATSPITLTQSGGTVNETTIYVRLKAGLAVGSYNSENISLSSSGADSKTVTCNGSVTTPAAPGVPTATAATGTGSNSFTANWNTVSGATGYYLDVYTQTTGGSASDLFFSEYIEGGSNNKALEIFNGTGASVDLTGYRINLYSNGASTATASYDLSGTLANGDVFVAAHSSATSAFTSVADYTVNGGVVSFNGDDAVALVKIVDEVEEFVDIFGMIGQDPGSAWTAAGGNTTVNKTLVRKSSVSEGITVNPSGYSAGDTSAFETLGTEWDMYDQDTYSYLGSHTFSGGSTKTYVSGYENRNVSNVLTYEVTGLDPETTYYYVVRAYDAYSQTSSSSNEIEVTTTAASTYDYPEDTEIDAGDVLIEITGGNGIIVSGTPTPVPNPGFTPTFEQRIELTGDGPWIVTVFSEDEWVACLFDGAWMVEEVPQSGTDVGYVSFLLEFPEGKNTIIELKSGNGGNPTLPVELSTFTATISSIHNAVLTWVTETETNVNGFYIYRNMENNLESALMVSNLIPATNTSTQQVYQFTDKELNQTGTYYYWLMVADMDGSEGFHGPISLNYEQGGLQLPEIPKFTELKNVYPNPFNPSTTISYALANSQNVNFNIFNNRGQMVRSMELGNKAAGNHSFVWDGCDNYGRSVSTGVYFIRMQAGSESFSKKAVLMK